LILLGKNRKYTDTVAEGRILPSVKELLQMGVTFLLVVIGWVFFRAESIGAAFDYLRGMMQWGTVRAYYRIFMMRDFWFILGMLVVEWLGRKNQFGLEKLGLTWGKFLRYVFYLVLSITIICFSFRKEVQEFIYFQF
jgi:hypothetical protein